MAGEVSGDRRGQVDGPTPDLARSIFVAIAVVAGLYLAREVLIPIALAVLLSFVLAIPVGLLQRLGLGRIFPVALVVVLTFLAIFSIGGIVANQVTSLAGDLPRYQSTIREKITSLRGAPGSHNPFTRIVEMVQGIGQDLKPAPEAKPGAPAPGAPAQPDPKPASGNELAAGNAPPKQPVPVEVMPAPSSPLETIETVVSPLLHPLATTGLVAIFVIFILLQRGDLRNRFIRLVGSHDLQRTTAAMNDAARRLSRFFLMQVLLNGSFGIIIGLGLWAIGVPSPLLWGILAAISRFIPYVGAIIAAGGPLVLAAAVDPNWTMLLETAALFALVELVMGQVVEPLLYGHSTGLSPIAVIVAVTFWTWLWGPVGLLLSTPLTVCLVVLGRHVDRMEFLDVMLGDRPPLTEVEVFYQRMLAGDPAEATEQAELYLKEHSLLTYYDEVAAKGLALAQADATRGALDDARMAKIDKAAEDLIDNLSEHDDVTPQVKAKSEADKEGLTGDEAAEAPALPDLPVLTPESLRPDWREGTPILCIAGRNALDRVGACMLAQLLEKHGLKAEVLPADVLTSSGIFGLDASDRRLICLSYLDTSSPVHVRYAVRRLRRKASGATILLGSWGVEGSTTKDLCGAAKSDLCAGTLRDAVRLCIEAAQVPDAAAEPVKGEGGQGEGGPVRLAG
jgi:predicted PurR-regulated permease PerM